MNSLPDTNLTIYRTGSILKTREEKDSKLGFWISVLMPILVNLKMLKNVKPHRGH